MRSNTTSVFYILLLRVIIVFLALLEVIHFNLKGLNFVMPNFIIISMYFWGIHQDNRIFSKEFLIMISLLSEILKGELLGISTIIYLIFLLIITNQRRFFINKPFIVIWVGFIIFSIFVFTIKIITLGFFYQRFLVQDYLVIQWLLTIGLYTVIHWLYYYLRYIVLEPLK